jgi:hypothetical protein
MDPILIEYLKKKQGLDAQGDLSDSLTKAGSQLGAAIAGAKAPDMSAVDQAAKVRDYRSQKIQDYFEKQQAEKDRAEAAREKRLADQAFRSEQKQSELSWKADQNDRDRKSQEDLKKLVISSAAAKKDAEPPKPTVADKAYAKDYNEWTSTGKPSYDKNIKVLEESIADLEANKDSWTVSNRAYAVIPDAVRPTLSRRLEQDIRGAVQGTLKAILGAQFTAREGELVMKRAYDPTLPPEENLRKAKLILEELRAAHDAQQAKVRFYEDKGTLAGYKSGSVPKSADNYDNMSEAELAAEYAKRGK